MMLIIVFGALVLHRLRCAVWPYECHGRSAASGRWRGCRVGAPPCHSPWRGLSDTPSLASACRFATDLDLAWATHGSCPPVEGSGSGPVSECALSCSPKAASAPSGSCYFLRVVPALFDRTVRRSVRPEGRQPIVSFKAGREPFAQPFAPTDSGQMCSSSWQLLDFNKGSPKDQNQPLSPADLGLRTFGPGVRGGWGPCMSCASVSRAMRLGLPDIFAFLSCIGVLVEIAKRCVLDHV